MAPGHRRILYVEDDAETAALLRMALEEEGFVVDWAPNGSAALQRFRASPPDLVLLDIVMPGMSGWQVLASITALRDPPPVVMISGSADLRNAIAAGAVAIVAKPFSVSEVMSTTRRVLGMP